MSLDLNRFAGAGIPFGLLIGVFFLTQGRFEEAVLTGVIAGLTFGSMNCIMLKLLEDHESPLIARYEKRRDEQIEWSCLANYMSNIFNICGGKLVLTNQRLLFSPNRIDQWLGADIWCTGLHNVQDIDIEAAGKSIIKSGLAKRLRVVLQHGEPQYFLVANPDLVLARLRTGLDCNDYPMNRLAAREK